MHTLIAMGGRYGKRTLKRHPGRHLVLSLTAIESRVLPTPKVQLNRRQAGRLHRNHMGYLWAILINLFQESIGSLWTGKRTEFNGRRAIFILDIIGIWYSFYLDTRVSSSHAICSLYIFFRVSNIAVSLLLRVDFGYSRSFLSSSI